jgi:hypothetical protein
MYKHTLRKAAGHTLGVDLEGKAHETDTHQCPHCSKHFDFVHGQTYGFCMHCMKATCGAKGCLECFPFEERMDLFEKGLLPELTSSKDCILPSHKRIILP